MTSFCADQSVNTHIIFGLISRYGGTMPVEQMSEKRHVIPLALSMLASIPPTLSAVADTPPNLVSEQEIPPALSVPTAMPPSRVYVTVKQPIFLHFLYVY